MTPENQLFQDLIDAYWEEKTWRTIMRLNLWFMETCGITEKDIRAEIFGESA